MIANKMTLLELLVMRLFHALFINFNKRLSYLDFYEFIDFQEEIVSFVLEKQEVMPPS